MGDGAVLHRGEVALVTSDGVFFAMPSLQKVVLQGRALDRCEAELVDCEKTTPPPASHVRSTVEAAGGAVLFLAGVIVGTRATRR